VKGLKPSVISMLAVGLVAGSAVGVAAQEEPSKEAASVTGRAAWFGEVSAGTQTSSDGIVAVEDVVHNHIWSASDPRLSGEVTYTGNWYFVPDPYIGIQSGTYELTNDEGSWLGDATAYGSEALGVDADVVVFTGRGGYEGLTAYVVLDWGSQDVSGENIQGVIFPSAMPPVPEPYSAE
jgi:hypothetical protein